MAILRLTVMMGALCALLTAAPARTEEPAVPRVRAALLQGDLPGHDAGLAGDLTQALKDAGYDVVSVNVDVVSDAAKLTREQFDMLVLPCARTLPLQTIKPIQAFLKAGGNLIAMGLPAWDEPAVLIGGRWTTKAERDGALARVRPERGIVAFATEDAKNWQRATNQHEPVATYAVEPDGEAKVLHVTIPNLTGWETYGRNVTQAFATGQTLTCFRAKGTERTQQLAVEWIEKDGSRWIATVDLATEWRWYALPPEAFHPWQPPVGRGGAGDGLKVENATRLTVGLALTHTHMGGGRHEYWFADLGAARNPLGDVIPTNVTVPHIDGLSPSYQFYKIGGPVRRLFGPGPHGPWEAKLPANLLALHPRPGGGGFRKDRAWRWQPLLSASPPDYDYRDALAALTVHAQGPYRGSATAAFAPADPAFYRQREIRDIIQDTAKAMRIGVFLLEGGSEYCTVREGDPVRLGATVIATRTPLGLSVHMQVVPDNATNFVYYKTWSMTMEAGKTASVVDAWQPAERDQGGYHILTWFRAETTPLGGVHGGIRDQVHILRPPKKPEFVEVRDGHFWLKGKPWRAHGVNYMPSTGIGIADNEIFEYWLDTAAYDPAIVARDLRSIKAMGLNAISVFVYHRSLKAENLLDLLRQCKESELKVNLSLRPGTPLDFRWDEMKEIIEHYDLAKNDTVFAYDLAWEPSHYDHDRQKAAYAAPWTEWVTKKHGGVEQAEKAWGTAAPHENGKLSVPPMKQLTQDGPWRKLSADYRAFLDQLLGEKYAEARRLIRSVDPNHLVSFRMQFSGDPTFNSEGMLPYDFDGLRDAVDIWEPEAYGRIGDWDAVKPGEFTAAYARMCNPKLPVVWAEMGTTVWDMNRMAPHPDRVRFAAQYYRDFYRMMRQSGVDGVFFWWFPGGFRVNEKSDYGIVNPDGTDREVTQVIREEGPAFLAASLPAAPDTWIEVDRDRDARGLYGIYEQVKDAYWKARGEGQNVGLRHTR